MSKRELFSGRFATIITMIGISIGLGNVWRFPYMMGEYGGSAFLVIFLIFSFFFAVPAVMAEWSLGRSSRQGPVGAFSSVFGDKVGRVIGWSLIFTIVIAESYYLYIIANVGFSASFSIFNGFTLENLTNYNQSLNNGWLQYGICLFLLLLSYYVMARGLKRGLEFISQLFVPFFVGVMILLIIFALQLDNAPMHLMNFLKPDFSQLESSHVFAALGQAFYSLGLGGTFLIVFGSYIRPEDSLGKDSIYMALGDVGAAVMAGLFIVPTVLALGLNMSQGPGLLFSTLPELFIRMPNGQFIGSLFLVALLLVTFISSIAALEVIVTGIDDAINAEQTKISRNKITAYICVLVSLVLIYISYNPSIIGTLDLIFGSGMQLLGSMLVLLGVTWGVSKVETLRAVFGDSSEQGKRWHQVYYYWVKWVVPAALLSVLIGYIYSKI